MRNIRDESESWAAELGTLMHRHARQDIDTDPVLGPPFSDPERLEIRWRQATVSVLFTPRRRVDAPPSYSPSGTHG